MKFIILGLFLALSFPAFSKNQYDKGVSQNEDWSRVRFALARVIEKTKSSQYVSFSKPEFKKEEAVTDNSKTAKSVLFKKKYN